MSFGTATDEAVLNTALQNLLTITCYLILPAGRPVEEEQEQAKNNAIKKKSERPSHLPSARRVLYTAETQKQCVISMETDF